DLHETNPLLNGQRRRLARRAVYDDAMGAFGDLPLDESGIGLIIDCAGTEGCDERREGAPQESLVEPHHHSPCSAARLVPKPSSTPSRASGSFRLSCQRRLSIARLSG